MNDPATQIDHHDALIQRRFRAASTKSCFAKGISKDPTIFTHVAVPEPSGIWTLKPEPEAAFSVHIVLTPLPRLEARMEGRKEVLGAMRAGEICIFDLGTSPRVLIRDPMQTLRVQMSQRSLDDLADEFGRPPIGSLRPTFGVEDSVLFGLGTAMLKKTQMFGDEDALFLDHVALAFHLHIAQTYGQLRSIKPLRGGLAPWQYRRATELMSARIAEGVTLAELAEACELSVNYFARAFRRTAEMPAHKWLMRERVRQAKNLLLNMEMPAAEVAVACGFTDQSHFTRIFSQLEGKSPARWRRLRLDDPRQYLPRFQAAAMP
ncbi:AraC family transcriptional regulator [Mesorhizobium sp. B2-3-5]|uniref:helix-turn-helix domain-containing protein n=1 Tax=Mesorhizobium sp. B2-3-5 TaxID=2589958 RepID=UPI0011291DBC|nr:AraC family transcriptional regulator [Mesorhizobium sp. B2-3-5]TPM21733.1 helix-turn-helix transcriptional regulator [Mesorhizobium sp. B2-3-5]